MNDSLRSRIYGKYLSAAGDGYLADGATLSPSFTAALASRRPYLDQLVARHFPPDRSARIVDIGCGHGALGLSARRFGYHSYVGVDGAPEQVDLAAALGVEGVRHGDAFDFLANVPERSVDCLMMFDVIEHFTDDELLTCVDGALRALAPGGRWIIHVPNAEGPFGARMRHGDITHLRAFTRASLTQLLRASGFRVVDCFEDRPVVHGVTSALRAAGWVVLRTALRGYQAIETGDTCREGIFSQNLLAVASK